MRIVMIETVQATTWSQVGGFQTLAYPFNLNDAGKAHSRRPKQNNDCTVRALALVLGMDYDTAYDLLADEGRKCSHGFNMRDWLNEREWAHKIAFPAVKGRSRMNPATFCKMYSHGRYICRTAKHVFAVIDGVLHDTWQQRPDRCIYTAWKVDDNAKARIEYDASAD